VNGGAEEEIIVFSVEPEHACRGALYRSAFANFLASLHDHRAEASIEGDAVRCFSGCRVFDQPTALLRRGARRLLQQHRVSQSQSGAGYRSCCRDRGEHDDAIRLFHAQHLDMSV